MESDAKSTALYDRVDEEGDEDDADITEDAVGDKEEGERQLFTSRVLRLDNVLLQLLSIAGRR